MKIRLTRYAMLLFAVLAGLASSDNRGATSDGGRPLVPICFEQAREDWPMWGRQAVRTFYTAAANAPDRWDSATGARIKWSALLGTHAYGSPVLSDGVIYVGTNNEGRRDPGLSIDAGVLMAFQESDGRFLWQRVSPKLPSGRVNDWPGLGLASTPAIDSDAHRLWYCTNRCEVVCLDVAARQSQPRVVWTLDMVKELNVFPHNLTTCSPLIWDRFVYVITANGVDDSHKFVVHPDAPAIVCIEKATGKIVWQDNSPGKNVLHSQWSNPTLAEVEGRTLVIAPLGDSWIYAFDARSGEIIWKFDANSKESVYPETRNEIIATPVIVDRRMYIAVGQDPDHGEGYGRLWCVDITGMGDVSAELDVNRNTPKPVVNDLPPPPEGDGPLRKGKPNPNSKVVWQYEKFDLNHDGRIDRSEHMNRTISNAAVDPAKNLLFIADFSGFLHCLNSQTGEIYWTHDLESSIWSTPLICDGKVYQSDEDGDVFVFLASKEKYLLAQNNLESAIHASPIFANGVLYLNSRDHLYAIH